MGLDKIVEAAGDNAKDAALLLITDKLTEIVQMQAEAIKNIKIDKVTVWDTGGNSSDGQTSTANFLSGLYKSVPALEDVFNMAGMELPNYLKGKSLEEGTKTEPVNKPKPVNKPRSQKGKGGGPQGGRLGSKGETPSGE